LFFGDAGAAGFESLATSLEKAKVREREMNKPRKNVD
jgi:hypothetical protein